MAEEEEEEAGLPAAPLRMCIGSRLLSQTPGAGQVRDSDARGYTTQVLMAPRSCPSLP